MPSIPRILDYSGNGCFGLVAMLLALGFLLSLGKSGAFYLQKLSAASKPGSRMVNYKEEIQETKATILLTFTTVLSIAFAVTSLLLRFRYIHLALLDISVVLGVTILVLALKYLLNLILDAIFHLNFKVARIWMFLVYLFLGVSSLLIALIASYSSDNSAPLISLAVLLSIAFLTEIFVLVKNFFQKPIHFFYIFLYLCAAEILPLAVALRAVSNVLN